MYSIELILSPQLYPTCETPQPAIGVGVDVLRATTAICAALKAGAEHIVPLDSLEQLAIFATKGYTLAAERNGSKIDGAKCGNSPTEYLRTDLHGQRLAYSTTNGTRCLLRLADCGEVYAGCFSNLSVLATYLADRKSNIIILCSGWKGTPSFEDTLFSGGLIQKLIATRRFSIANDSATMALQLWEQNSDNLEDACRKATHVHRLIKLGYEEDIQFSLQLDTCGVIPRLVDGCIKDISNL